MFTSNTLEWALLQLHFTMEALTAFSLSLIFLSMVSNSKSSIHYLTDGWVPWLCAQFPPFSVYKVNNNSPSLLIGQQMQYIRMTEHRTPRSMTWTFVITHCSFWIQTDQTEYNFSSNSPFTHHYLTLSPSRSQFPSHPDWISARIKYDQFIFCRTD